MSILGCACVLSVEASAIVLLQALQSVGLHMYTDALRWCAVSPTAKVTIILSHLTRDEEEAVCTSMNDSKSSQK